MVGEINWVLFDLFEVEGELVVGFYIEYLLLKFVMFMFVEYVNMIMVLVLVVILFFGGWYVFWLLNMWVSVNIGWWLLIWFIVKVWGFLFIYFWLWVMLLWLCYD